MATTTKTAKTKKIKVLARRLRRDQEGPKHKAMRAQSRAAEREWEYRKGGLILLLSQLRDPDAEDFQFLKARTDQMLRACDDLVDTNKNLDLTPYTD